MDIHILVEYPEVYYSGVSNGVKRSCLNGS